MRLSYIISVLTLFTVEQNENTKLLAKSSFDNQSPCHFHDLKKEITPKGNFFDFKLISKDKYFLRWGNESLSRILRDTFYCDSPPTARPSFEEENDKYLVLRFGCGSPCWAGIFLPLNPTQRPKTIYSYYDFDLANNLVASLELDGSEPVICVDNLLTKTKKKYKVDYECESAIPTYCLDSLSISNHKLYYKWTSDFKTNKKRERIITLQ